MPPQKRTRVRLTRRELLHYVGRLEKFLGYADQALVIALVSKDFDGAVSPWTIRVKLRKAIADGYLIKARNSYKIRLNPDVRDEAPTRPDLTGLPGLLER